MHALDGGSSGAAAALDSSSGSGSGAAAAYACYFLIGACLLAPWNALITAADYWQAIFPGRHVDRALTVAYLPACLALVTACLAWPERVPAPRARILVGFAGFAVVMAFVPLVCARFSC
jgi:equilibrative nucleoside transporter 1/2/3